MLHCRSPETARAGMRDHRNPLQQQAQSLPVNGGDYLRGHPGKANQRTVQFASRPLPALQYQRGIKNVLPGLITDALSNQPLARWCEGPIVFVPQLQERRNMESLRKAVFLVFACR